MKTKKKAVARPIRTQDLSEYVEQAYLNYSMAVVLERALPQLADGLKPVQRRIIYAMSELGLASSAKYKKSARTIGDVLGKFHPHGDMACYEAMVLMAQSFSTRYPLIDGQGNWGSIDDPKSFAAMRYTEARLTPYAQLLLAELNREITNWQPNFDGTLSEPILLPARVPNLLLNGAAGIAVGMATDIPSHNLTEVMDACCFLLDRPAAKLEEIMKNLPAPDFPSGGIIVSSQADMRDIYHTGQGSIKVRASWSQPKKGTIVINSLPPQIAVTRVTEQLRQQMDNRQLPMLVDIRDESDHDEPVRLVLNLRKGSNAEELMAHLFAKTELEKSIRANFNAIDKNAKPCRQSLVHFLTQWLDFRYATVEKRLRIELAAALARLHVLQGLLAVYLNLDEVLHIIRTEDKPKPFLMKKFKLSEIQADAILETRLRHLARLEEMKIRQEEEDLTDKRYMLEKLLTSPQAIRNILKQEFQQIKKRFGDERRTIIRGEKNFIEARSFRQEQLVSREAVTLIVSQKGWVRVAKGHNITARDLSYRGGDNLLCSWKGQNDMIALFLDSQGRSYSLSAFTLPSARGLGEPVSSKLDMVDGASIQAGMLVAAAEQEEVLLLAKNGYGFIARAADLIALNRRKGKQVMNIKDGKGIVLPVTIDARTKNIALLGTQNKLLIINTEEVPRLQKGRGVKLLDTSRDNFVVQVLALPPGGNMRLSAPNTDPIDLSPAMWKKYCARRGGRGKSLGKFSAQLRIENID